MKDFSSDDVIRLFSKLYDNVPFIVTYKAPDLKYLYCNHYMMNYVGCQSQKDVIGKYDVDFCWERFEPYYHKHVHDAFSHKIYIAMLPTLNSQGELALAMINRMPYFDEENNPVGVLTHSYLVTNRKALEFTNLILKNESQDKLCAYSIGKEMDGVCLTTRERECLFYFIRGKSCKTIGKVLGISFRTVENYMENIKTKFMCNNKNELVEKAIALGYLYDIPPTLFNTTLIEAFK